MSGMKPQHFSCPQCGARWVGAKTRCPNGCDVVAKSDGEFTKKTLQGEDDDLRKSFLGSGWPPGRAR